MNHVTTRKTRYGLQVLYQGESLAAPKELEYVTRAAIGVVFDPAYAVVVLERDFDEGRQFVVIDEEESVNAQGLFSKIIALKDRYLVPGVFCPNDLMADALRRQEGLTHYRNEPSRYLRYKFPSFVDTATTATVRDMPVPEEHILTRDIDYFLSETVMNDGFPVLLNKKPQKMLIILGSEGANFHTHSAAQAIQSHDVPILQAIHHAITGLNESPVYIEEFHREHTGSRITGY